MQRFLQDLVLVLAGEKLLLHVLLLLEHLQALLSIKLHQELGHTAQLSHQGELRWYGIGIVATVTCTRSMPRSTRSGAERPLTLLLLVGHRRHKKGGWW